MKEVIEFSLNTFEKVIIVGSDIPSLTAKDIMDSLNIKSANNIFYPTVDGGFCLLLTSDNKILDIIDKIKYGTDNVLEDLTKNLSQLFINNKFYHDIDVKEDLPKIYQSLKDNNSQLIIRVKNFTHYFILIKNNLMNNLFGKGS